MAANDLKITRPSYNIPKCNYFYMSLTIVEGAFLLLDIISCFLPTLLYAKGFMKNKIKKF